VTPAADTVLLPVHVKDKDLHMFLCIAACIYLKMWKCRVSVKHSVKCISNTKKTYCKISQSSVNSLSLFLYLLTMEEWWLSMDRHILNTGDKNYNC